MLLNSRMLWIRSPLKEALHRATMSFEYVHRAESCRLEGEEEADKIWA